MNSLSQWLDLEYDDNHNHADWVEHLYQQVIQWIVDHQMYIKLSDEMFKHKFIQFLYRHSNHDRYIF